jgi:uncharacterized protein (TIGR02996 family)
MRSFEFTDDKSNKFWNIELEGSKFIVTFGRIGTSGQTQTKEFKTVPLAKAAHDKLVAEKLGKGYVETTPKKSAAAQTKGKKPAAPAIPTPLQLALEKALVDNPDDLAAHSAYADYLSEQGDPRGEFIQVQLALENPKVARGQRQTLQRREKALLKKHGQGWLGALADFLWNQKAGEAEYTLARGWLDYLGIRLLTGPCARALAQAPQARLLRALEIADVENIFHRLLDDLPEDEETDLPGLEPLTRSPYLGNIRILAVGTVYDLRESSFHYTALSLPTITEATALVQRLPRLERLFLEGRLEHVDRLFGLKTLANLRSLQLCFAQEYPLEILARNRSLDQLEYILFHPQDGDEPAITLAGVRALLRSPHLKKLVKLRLHLTTIGDEGCAAIVQSGILRRLKVLDLGFGSITDEGARILAACPDLRKLELLDVQRNALTKKGIAALRKVGKEVHADAQHDPDDPSYLFEGEME